jgi:hypothetical protein
MLTINLLLMHMSFSWLCAKVFIIIILIVMLYNSKNNAAFYYSPYYVAKKSGKFSYSLFQLYPLSHRTPIFAHAHVLFEPRESIFSTKHGFQLIIPIFSL